MDGYIEAILIPLNLLRAAGSFEAFRSEHLRYWVRHGGQWGLCNYREAFEYLSSDMREHGLPVRYSSFGSFQVLASRRRA